MTRLALALCLLIAGCAPHPHTHANAAHTHAQQRDAYADALSAVRVLVPDLVAPNRVDTTRTDYALMLTMFGGRNVFANNEWLATVAEEYGYAASVAVYAHELGHLPQVTDAFRLSTTDDGELLADAIAGCALAVLNLPVEPYARLLADNIAVGAEERAFAAVTGREQCDRSLPR